MTNLRDRDAYRDRAWDWGFLNDCFGMTRIKASDIDGIIERNGRFLVIEAKPTDKAVEGGQRIMLDALARLSQFTVLILYGEPSIPVAMQYWPNQRVEATQESVCEFVSAWFQRANQIARAA